jgi:superfamily I DNA/RNA helicase
LALLDQLQRSQILVVIGGTTDIGRRSAGHWQDFTETMTTLHLGSAGWPSEIDYACRWYTPHLERKYEDALQRQADIAQLAQIAATYATRERFLTELTLDPPEATSDQAGPPLLDEDYLILSTIHSAKGQEWTAVFVLNAVDGCIPSDLGVGTTHEIEEERRLLYVAMTRAKDQLHVMVPQNSTRMGSGPWAAGTSTHSAPASYPIVSADTFRAGRGHRRSRSLTLAERPARRSM